MPDIPVRAWGYTEAINARRREHLEHFQSWTQVLEVCRSLQVEAVALEFRHDHHHQGARGAYRASWRIHVGEKAIDALYNSPAGLRAHYSVSPALGEMVSRQLITACLSTEAQCDMGPGVMERVEYSTRVASAKVCLPDEAWPDVQEIQINYQPWVTQVGRGLRLADTGVLAPLSEAFVVKGGWIHEEQEWIDPLKVDRAELLHRFGFA